MAIKRTNAETSNFWVSYADLMAGLLFVFILLIGAIVIKSIVLKSNLSSKEKTLLETKYKLDKKNQALDSTKILLENKNQEIKKLKMYLEKNKAKLNKLAKKIIILQSNIIKLNSKVKLRDDLLKKYKGDIIVLSNQIKDANKTIELKDRELAQMLSQLRDSNNRYAMLIEDLKTTKERIKNLTGIKIRVIGILKEALGDRIKLDKSGGLRISSNILFDKDKAVLKEEAKKELEEVFTRYIMTLVVNPEIKSHLDKIIIEGHTDSDGGFLYNLNLSQARAYSVMNYLLSLKMAKDYDIKKYILASGRSYLDPILDENGKEDKDASRRIEIKFLLKNDKAMQEIERILDEK
jgi:chemotaxis protein MotB